MNPTPATESHRHDFHTDTHAAERGSRAVLWITLTAMAVEIAAGWWYGSMALLADGWHMSSHAVAIGITVLAYAAARRLANDHRFAFGTWKIEVLGGFASAWLLLGVAALMLVASVDRYFDPQPIRYREAVFVAVLGLVVNLVCAWILARGGHDHGHHHGHSDEHDHHEHQHGDMNLRSAYLHVLADALTSVLAILALLGGWVWGWDWLDPLMGVVGAVLVAVWAKGLIRDTSTVLLDCEMDHPVVAEIREVVEQLAPASGVSVTDLHVWRVGRDSFACAITVLSDDPALDAQRVRQALLIHEELVHTTIEIQHTRHSAGVQP